MKLHTQLLATAALVGFTATTQAVDVIRINDTNLGTVDVASFDWTPDNALAVDSLPLPFTPDQNSFVLYAQGALGNYIDTASNVIGGTGLNEDYEITFQAGFGELGTQVQAGNQLLAAFELDPAASVNFFEMYYDTNQDADTLAGTGFDNGDLILTGIVVSQAGSSFSILLDQNGIPQVTALDDSADGDQYVGIGTVIGTGGAGVNVDVSGQDQMFDFFVSNINGLLVDLVFNTNLKTPFQEANPAAMVVGNTPNYGAGIGPFVQVNGNQICGDGVETCDFQFQQDANNSFFETRVVPEPSMLALLGIGLLSAFAARRKRV